MILVEVQLMVLVEVLAPVVFPFGFADGVFEGTDFLVGGIEGIPVHEYIISYTLRIVYAAMREGWRNVV